MKRGEPGGGKRRASHRGRESLGKQDCPSPPNIQKTKGRVEKRDHEGVYCFKARKASKKR